MHAKCLTFSKALCFLFTLPRSLSPIFEAFQPESNFNFSDLLGVSEVIFTYIYQTQHNIFTNKNQFICVKLIFRCAGSFLKLL